MQKIDDLLKDMRGGEWKPMNLLDQIVVKNLLDDVMMLKAKVEGLDAPQIKNDLARLNLDIAKAHLNKTKDQAAFVAHIANALIGVQTIVEWYSRNKPLLKGEK